eukprot:2903130-Rhodomonas_salina.1
MHCAQAGKACAVERKTEPLPLVQSEPGTRCVVLDLSAPPARLEGLVFFAAPLLSSVAPPRLKLPPIQ